MIMGSTISPSDMVSLKAKINAMLEKRGNPKQLINGQKISDYVNSFSTTPTDGGKITEDQGKKTLDLLLMINNMSNTVLAKSGEKIPRGFTKDAIETFINNHNWDGITTGSNKAGCRGACVGTCYNDCFTTNQTGTKALGCSGCANSCIGGCVDKCTNE